MFEGLRRSEVPLFFTPRFFSKFANLESDLEVEVCVNR